MDPTALSALVQLLAQPVLLGYNCTKVPVMPVHPTVPAVHLPQLPAVNLHAMPVKIPTIW